MSAARTPGIPWVLVGLGVVFAAVGSVWALAYAASAAEAAEAACPPLWAGVVKDGGSLAATGGSVPWILLPLGALLIVAGLWLRSRKRRASDDRIPSAL